jgi:acetyl esterase/lipase
LQALLFVLGIVSGLFVANAFGPRRGWLRLPSFFASWATIELAAHWLAALAVVAVVAVAGGGLDGPMGIVGLLLMALAAAGLVVFVLESRKTEGAMRGIVAELGRTADIGPSAGSIPKPPRYSRLAVVFPIAFGRRRGVQKLRNLTYARVGGRTLKLDLTMPAKTRPGDLRPVVLQLHGGGWFMGDKRQQGLPLTNHLAAEGWVTVNANYRLSPSATFPEHLIDCKRALAWIRSHISDYGGDPDNVSVTGGSSGGHLATMLALTANRPEYQPGFEHIDTTVRAAVPIYGVYDLTNRLGTWPDVAFRRLLEPWVVKGFLAEEPELFEAASPIDQVTEDAPPILIVHGTRDTLTPAEDARLFAQRLGTASNNPVLYAELQGAQHAFDIFPSIRTAKVVEGVERFLTMCARA